MIYPKIRLRRLRQNSMIRGLVSETKISPKELILPVFFDANITSTKATDSMPGVKKFPLHGYDSISSEIQSNNINSVMVFGIPNHKDPVGTDAYNSSGVVQRAIHGLKESSDITVIADLCLCEYTDHGHCGILDHNGNVLNDKTIELYGKIATSQADAGADIIAPSGMMDGQVTAIRQALDDSGHKNVPIMAYSAKFLSAYYGPFRDIANSSPGHGDRAGYQIYCGNRREAMREVELDIIEGADIIMVKPAGPYLDIIRDVANTFNSPIAAYQVSGEYSMIKAAAQNGWIDKDKIMMESLLGIKRAGANMIITYFAKEAANYIVK